MFFCRLFGKEEIRNDKKYTPRKTYKPSVDEIKRKNGEEAEKFVSNELNRLMVGFVIDNIKYPSKRTKSAQIDHILINQFGVFVIETKGHCGCITGNSQTLWQEMDDGSCYKLKPNPIRQNKKHWIILNDILQRNIGFKVPLFSYIVVTKATVILDDDYRYIGNMNEFSQYVFSKKPALSAEQIEIITGVLYQNALPITDEEHRQNIENHLHSLRNKNGSLNSKSA